ncbi:putative acid phosphatase-like [Rosellinia necatrix]|uniref:Putative acid phosphatase-like n=1 Tax=Rosellinia necatrix TaxID=77044 RepID=A0A1S7UKI1_ROSNE|nr:putative acid phosphatase-like [Rosellinia necatrix]
MAVNAVGTFFIVLVVLLVVAAVGWVVFTQLRARRLGLPSPPLSSYIPFARSSHQSSFGASQPQSGGLRGWVSDRFQSLKNPRSAAGAYEPSAPGGRRGFGALDPDDAWDTRVGHEPYGVGSYYPDDQELDDRNHHGRRGDPYSGSEYNMNPAADAADENRGRNPNPRPGGPDPFASRPAAGQHNPFDDAVEPSNLSLRGVSPRPIDTRRAAAAGAAGGPPHDSPTSMAERRSIFREDI